MVILQRILDFVEGKIFAFISNVCVLAMMSFTTFDVIARKFFNFSIPSLWEFTSEYLMVILVLLPLSGIYAKDQHIRVEVVMDRLPRVYRQRYHEQLLHVLALVLCIVLTILGWQGAMDAIEYNEISAGLIEYVLWPSYLIVPIGFGLMAIRIAFCFLSGLKNAKSKQ